MSKTVILLRDFSHNTIPENLSLGRAVVRGSIYANSAKFPQPPVTKADLQTQTDDLETKYDAARNRDSEAVAKQDTAERLLLSSLGALARYAAPIVYNDRDAIIATGFQPSDAEPHSAVVPGILEGIIKEGLTRGIRLKMPAGTGATFFTVIVTPSSSPITYTDSQQNGVQIQAGTAPIIVLTTTSRKITITGLNAGQLYDVYAYGTNAAGSGPMSQRIQVSPQA